MGKFSGLLKRIKNWFTKDVKNPYLIVDPPNPYLRYNDPKIIDPYYGVPEQLRPDRSRHLDEFSRVKITRPN